MLATSRPAKRTEKAKRDTRRAAEQARDEQLRYKLLDGEYAFAPDEIGIVAGWAAARDRWAAGAQLSEVDVAALAWAGIEV